MIDKRALVVAIAVELQAELDTMTRLARDAAEAATHEENKPENDKDMRSTEASYLARGQAGRVAELSTAIARLHALELRAFGARDEIDLSALVELESTAAGSARAASGRAKTTCFVVPAGGGRRVRVDGAEVQSTTPESPLGEALCGFRAGDEVEVETPQGARGYRIVAVR